MVSSDSLPPQAPRKAVSLLRYELLTFGNELLLGLTVNGHLGYIGAQLGRRGVELRRNVTVSDDARDIAEEFAASWARADVVITTGGLGPTCDDRTREAIAGALGQRLVYDEAIAHEIARRFAALGRKMTPNNLKQAWRFERCEVLANPNGTAPGLWVEQDGKVLCMLPGPPNELQPLFMDQVLPRLARLGLILERESYIQIRTAGIGESLLETRLTPLFEPHGDALQVAYCAHAGQVDCRLSSPDGARSHADLEDIAAACVGLLGDDFVCLGHDSLARVCADLLRGQERRLAVVETVSGGMLAQSFADICGAPKFFAGAVVCQGKESLNQLLDVSECVLHQHGAVSAEGAVAMATAAAEKLGADYALALSGFAGTCSGPKENPIGTIYAALHAPHGVWSRQFSYPGPRTTVNKRVVNAALDWLRRELLRARTLPAVPDVIRVLQ